MSLPETAAGTLLECRGCGKLVAIPSLRTLRASVGMAAPELPIEKIVETLLIANKLPEEKQCVLCGHATTAFISCRTECEQAKVVDNRPSKWSFLAAFALFGWLGALVAAAKSVESSEQEWGKDIAFDLPIRVCEACKPTLGDAGKLKQAVAATPLYRRLLDRFPQTRMSLRP
jgi:hypothetical protein